MSLSIGKVSHCLKHKAQWSAQTPHLRKRINVLVGRGLRDGGNAHIDNRRNYSNSNGNN